MIMSSSAIMPSSKKKGIVACLKEDISILAN
jgi:hypothetical protein